MVVNCDRASWQKSLLAELQFAPNRSADAGAVHVHLRHQCDCDWKHVVMDPFNTERAEGSQ